MPHYQILNLAIIWVLLKKRHVFSILRQRLILSSPYRTQQLDAIDDPLAAVFKIKAAVDVFATQKGPPYTSGDAVVVGRIV